MLVVFQIVLSVPVISWIESILSWRAEGEGEVGEGRKPKATIWTQITVLCLQYTIHRVGQDCR